MNRLLVAVVLALVLPSPAWAGHDASQDLSRGSAGAGAFEPVQASTHLRPEAGRVVVVARVGGPLPALPHLPVPRCIGRICLFPYGTPPLPLCSSDCNQAAAGHALSASLLTDDGPLPGRRLDFSLAGSTCSATTGTDGRAGCVIAAPAGAHESWSVAFAGDAAHAASRATGWTGRCAGTSVNAVGLRTC